MCGLEISGMRKLVFIHVLVTPLFHYTFSMNTFITIKMI